MQTHFFFLKSFGPVPSKNRQTRLPSEVTIFTWKMPIVVNRMKSQFSDFYFPSYGWLYLQFTSMSPQFLCASPTKKKFVHLWPNLQERQMRKRIALRQVFLEKLFFCATWSFWNMVDFIYVQFWCKRSNTWNHPYTKLTTSQKLKVTQKKLVN